MKNVIGIEKKLIKFDIDPLAAASSGELTSLVYSCDEKNLSGLVLGFYGSRWNDAGVVYQAYAFKNLPEKNALEFYPSWINILTKNQNIYQQIRTIIICFFNMMI